MTGKKEKGSLPGPVPDRNIGGKEDHGIRVATGTRPKGPKPKPTPTTVPGKPPKK